MDLQEFLYLLDHFVAEEDTAEVTDEVLKSVARQSVGQFKTFLLTTPDAKLKPEIRRFIDTHKRLSGMKQSSQRSKEVKEFIKDLDTILRKIGVPLRVAEFHRHIPTLWEKIEEGKQSYYRGLVTELAPSPPPPETCFNPLDLTNGAVKDFITEVPDPIVQVIRGRKGAYCTSLEELITVMADPTKIYYQCFGHNIDVKEPVVRVFPTNPIYVSLPSLLQVLRQGANILIFTYDETWDETISQSVFFALPGALTGGDRCGLHASKSIYSVVGEHFPSSKSATRPSVIECKSRGKPTKMEIIKVLTEQNVIFNKSHTKLQLCEQFKDKLRELY